MSLMRIEVENQTFSGPLQSRIYDTWVPDKLECGCGESANLKVNGDYHCWECAKEAGIERI